MPEKPRLKILFLCTGNACRSQMAEAFARELKDCDIEPHSAGVAPYRILPETVEVMQEIEYDLAGQDAKGVGDLKDINFDYVITLCGHAHENCPVFPGKTRVIHVGFDDPPRAALGARTHEEALGHYRRVRDEIRAFIETLPQALEDNN